MSTRGWEGVKAADLARPVQKPALKRQKYGAVKTTVDGITFDSAKEARRWSELRLLERAGQIDRLERQSVFPIDVPGPNGIVPCGVYRADFSYRKRNGTARVVEDVKGMRTPVYKLKKKLVEALYGIKITEL